MLLRNIGRVIRDLRNHDVARDVANADRLTTWNLGDEFHPAWKKNSSK